MITKMKSEGAVSTAGQSVKKGNKGKLELFASRIDSESGVEDFILQFCDYGNYGRERWAATFPCHEADIVEMIDSLKRLLSGDAETTRYEELVAEEAQPQTGEPESDSRQVEFERAAEVDEDDEEDLIEHLLAQDEAEFDDAVIAADTGEFSL